MNKQKKEKIVSIRFTEADYKLFRFVAYTMGLTPSKVLRMLADSSINAIKLQLKRGDLKNEDIETLFNDKL